MPGSWKDYKDWKELLEGMRRKPDDENFQYDDDTDDINDIFKEYID